MARKKAVPKENSERWLLTYADLITLLMVFFVLLFAMSKTDTAKFQQLAASLHNALGSGIMTGSKSDPFTQNSGNPDSIIEQQVFDHIKSAVNKFTKDNNLDGSKIISITVSGALLFYNGTDQIKSDGTTLLKSIGEEVRSLTNNVRIEGHTDDIPIESDRFSSNWDLSAARAVAVVRYMADQAKIQPKRLSAVGFGQYQPIVPNDTREHRETNRRAVIIILFDQNKSTSTTPTATPSATNR
jgi:chemotaxis protein MotB